MKRIVCLTAILALVVMASARAQAATEVKMVGDALVYGTFFTNRNFTGWNPATWTSATPTWKAAGTKTAETFEIWERFRLRTDFVASEAVKFRLGIKVEDTWGHGTFTAANPAVSLMVYQAFLQFKWPGRDAEITAGQQHFALPQSGLFFSSPVFGNDHMTALIIKTPLVGKALGLVTGFGRLIDTNRTYDPSTTQVADELDAYFLTLPVTLDGLTATPWGMVVVAGRNADYFLNKSSQQNSSFYADNLLSAGSFISPKLWKNSQNPYWWGGGAFEVSALDPVRFYADVIYGAGAENDRKKSARQGWFLDAGAEYTGWDILTPQVYAWWSTGEDGSTRNGSERMPMIRPDWGPGNSFLFDCSQELVKNSNMGMSPVGSWGLGASLDNISFIQKLGHRLTFDYVRGTNSATAIRDLNVLLGSNPYFTMGRDLTVGEYVLGANLDTTYKIYHNLGLVLETGWAHGEFERGVWGRRLVNQARDSDTWKVAFGLRYKF